MENGWMINLAETPPDAHTPDLTITRKTNVMDRNKQQIANNLIVNSGRPSGGKDKKGRLRAELNQLRQDLQNQTSSIETLQKSYTSLRGKLLHYRSTNPEPAKKLIAELDLLKF